MALQLKPTDKILHNYQLTLREFRHASIEHESATRSAFQTLLAELARRRKWQLIPGHPYKLAPGAFVKPDATLRDDFSINRGYREAKDTRDDLETEIRAKTARGYPESNIIYDDTARAILIQNRARPASGGGHPKPPRAPRLGPYSIEEPWSNTSPHRIVI